MKQIRIYILLDVGSLRGQTSTLCCFWYMLMILHLCPLSYLLFCLLTTWEKAQDVDIVNKEVKSVVEWLKVNKMSPNLDKTHFMVFAPHNKMISLNRGIVMNGYDIPQVNHTKFLGIIIGFTLNCKEHVSYVCNKIDKILEFW